MTRSLIILRGLPGSGKTSLAKILSEGGKYPIFSIDDYFTNEKTGEYIFDHSKNYLAYAQCEERTIAAMGKSVEKIFLHNCFTLEWEMESYFKKAREYEYVVYVLTVENRHSGRNQHLISYEQIHKMAAKYKVILIPELNE